MPVRNQFESEAEFLTALSDWFAGQAPDEPTWHFEPVMSEPRPTPQMEGQIEDRICVNAQEVREWEDERDCQRAKQWPYAWANEMLAQRSKPVAETRPPD